MAHPPGNRSIACRCSDCAGPTQWAARRRALGRTPLSCPGRAQRDPGPRGSTSCGPWVPALARELAPRAKRRAEARARPGHERVAADAMALRHLADASHRVVSYSPCQTAQFLYSRLVLRPGSLPSFSPSSRPIPDRGDWRSAKGGVTALYVSRSNARRHACEAWALPRNREARLTALRRGVVGPGPPSRPGHDGRADAKAPRPPGIAARLRCRAFRIRGYQPRATPHPAPPSGSLLESAPHERDLRYIAQARDVVNNIFITYL
jgi:hypothetical protein